MSVATPIVKWMLSTYSDKPMRMEFARDTTHYYVTATGGRRAKEANWYTLHDSEAEALALAAQRRQEDEERRRLNRIKEAGPALLAVLVDVESLLPHLADLDTDATTARLYGRVRAAIAKAKGELA